MSQSTAPGIRSERIEVEVNGERRQLEPGADVARLLADVGLADARVAVAVNRAVVVRSRYREVRLADGDHVEILEAVGGG